MISVLVVHSSAIERPRLTRLLNAGDGIHVSHAVASGDEALALLKSQRPDVIAMEATSDQQGPEVVRLIMETTPVPIVVIGRCRTAADQSNTARFTEAGAVAALEPPHDDDPEYDLKHAQLARTVKAMAGIKVIRRWPRYRQRAKASLEALVGRGEGKTLAALHGGGRFHFAPEDPAAPRVVAVGVSTGGPPALQAMLGRLPRDFKLPILIVQHIAHGFIGGLVDWLDRTIPLAVRVASAGDVLQPGCVYLAPDHAHMGVNAKLQIVLDAGPPENGMRPAVSYLFRSVAAHLGGNAIAILMTGMGRDGASELKLLHDAGAMTIAQEKHSCVVFGMSAEAIKLGAARMILSPEQIGSTLTNLVPASPERRAMGVS